MNRLLIPTVAFVALLMAGCEDWDTRDWQPSSSDQRIAPAAPSPSPSEGTESTQ